MFNFGDELIIHSSRLHWLIWIQILITLLLVLAILASFSGLSSSDPLSYASSCSLGTPSTFLAPTQEPVLKERDQVVRNCEASVEVNTSAGSNRRGIAVENDAETDSSSLEDLSPKPISERVYHPCRFLDLAKEAFLKCLGLGSTPRDQTHED